MYSGTSTLHHKLGGFELLWFKGSGFWGLGFSLRLRTFLGWLGSRVSGFYGFKDA